MSPLTERPACFAIPKSRDACWVTYRDTLVALGECRNRVWAKVLPVQAQVNLSGMDSRHARAKHFALQQLCMKLKLASRGLCEGHDPHNAYHSTTFVYGFQGGDI